MQSLNSLDFGDVLADAEAELRKSYVDLPASYFHDKSASSFLFNNIELLDKFYPDTENDEPWPSIKSHFAPGAAARMYFGVPWCDQICSFCNFAYSTSKNADNHKAYVALLLQEVDLLLRGGLGEMQILSAYFGGGTPTILSDELFDGYLAQVLERLPLTENASITCEATPHTMTFSKAAIMCDRGITRLSMGIQSLDETVREQARLLGSPQEVLETIAWSTRKFDMVNVDLIYGYPYQSDRSWFDTVTQIASLEPPSITLYRLEVKSRTYNLKYYEREQDAFEDEHAARRKYFVAALLLFQAGYVESPLGWWIRKDKQLRSASWHEHMKGWTNATPYLGVGQGAWSQLARTNYNNHAELKSWSTAIQGGRLPIARHNRLDNRAALLTSILRIVRSTQNIDLASLTEHLEKESLLKRFELFLTQQTEWGLLELEGDCYRLTNAGKSLVHWLLRDLLLACLQD